MARWKHRWRQSHKPISIELCATTSNWGWPLGDCRPPDVGLRMSGPGPSFATFNLQDSKKTRYMNDITGPFARIFR
jgi:hypothetical protein